MKKIVMLLVVAVMMLGVAGNAMADFGTGELIRVVYQMSGSVEELTDLGAFNNTIAGTSYNVTSNAFAVSDFAGSNFADLQVAYFVWGANSNTAPTWVSGALGQNQANGSRQGTSWNSNALSVAGYGASKSGGTGKAIGNKSDLTSYYTKMDKGGNGVGAWGAFITLGGGEANLAALGTTGYVDQSIFYYSNVNTQGNGQIVATVRTMADGTTQINPNAPTTPIPAAVYLLGSGLLGLVGIRRKNVA
jgi:hypothetical protein